MQIAKLACFPTLGECARDNENVDPAMDYAIRHVAGGYTKLVACAVAMKTCLAKDIHASEDTLRDAIDAALTEKDKVLSVEVAKVLAAWVKLTTGTDEDPSPWQAHFAKLKGAHTSDYAGTVAANLAYIAKLFKADEDAKDTAILAARAK